MRPSRATAIRSKKNYCGGRHARRREAEKEKVIAGGISERMILATFVFTIILAFVFVLVAWACPECMPWHRPDARHIFW